MSWWTLRHPSPPLKRTHFLNRTPPQTDLIASMGGLNSKHTPAAAASAAASAAPHTAAPVATPAAASAASAAAADIKTPVVLSSALIQDFLVSGNDPIKSRRRRGQNPEGNGLKARSQKNVQHSRIISIVFECMRSVKSCHRDSLRHLGTPSRTFALTAMVNESVLALRLAVAKRLNVQDPTTIRLFVGDKRSQEMADGHDLHHYSIEEEAGLLIRFVIEEDENPKTILSDWELEMIETIVNYRSAVLKYSQLQPSPPPPPPPAAAPVSVEVKALNEKCLDLMNRMELINRERVSADTHRITIQQSLDLRTQDVIRLELKVAELVQRLQSQTDQIHRLQTDKSAVGIAALQNSLTADSQNALDDFPSSDQLIQRFENVLMKNNRYQLTYQVLSADMDPSLTFERERFLCRIIYEADELAERIWTCMKREFESSVGAALLGGVDLGGSLDLLAAPFAALCRQQHKALLTPHSKHWNWILTQFQQKSQQSTDPVPKPEVHHVALAATVTAAAAAPLRFDCKCDVSIGMPASEHAFNCVHRQMAAMTEKPSKDLAPKENNAENILSEEASRRDFKIWTLIKNATNSAELIAKLDAFRDEMIRFGLQIRWSVPSFRLGTSRLSQPFDPVTQRHHFNSCRSSSNHNNNHPPSPQLVAVCVHPALYNTGSTREPAAKATVICR